VDANKKRAESLRRVFSKIEAAQLAKHGGDLRAMYIARGIISIPYSRI